MARLICLTLFAFCAGLLAADIRISPGPSAIQDAINGANPGDVLVIGQGTYAERVTVEKPLTLRGERGARLDGAAPLQLAWTEVEGMDKVYRAPSERKPDGLLAGGKFVAELRHDRANGKGEWNWRTLLQKGPPLSGYSEIRALWIYQPEEQCIYARFENGLAPEQVKDLAYLPSGEPLLTIAGTQDVLVEGLIFAHGSTAVTVTRNARNITVRNCHITSFEHDGILLTDGAAACLVEACDITRGSLEEWQPSFEHNRPNYEIWRIHKEVGRYDRAGIELLRAGPDNRIMGNHLDRVFDGINLGDFTAESLDKPLPDANHGRGTEIAQNVVENTRDSGIELGVGCVGVNVHHNLLRRTHGGLRFKVPRTGPLFIHHNRLIDGSPFNIWLSMDASPAEAYVYHNTILRGDSAAFQAPIKVKRAFLAPKWHFLNNLLLHQKDGFFRTDGNASLIDFAASHNICTDGHSPWPADLQSTKDPGSRYGVEIGCDDLGRPEPSSAAVDAGLDLSTYLAGRPLPGCEPGYFRGKAPDAGADEAGVDP